MSSISLKNPKLNPFNGELAFPPISSNIFEILVSFKSSAKSLNPVTVPNIVSALDVNVSTVSTLSVSALILSLIVLCLSIAVFPAPSNPFIMAFVDVSVNDDLNFAFNSLDV